MKLQSKVLAILACLWVVICLIIFIDSKLTLEKKYQQLDYELATKDLHRAQNAIKEMLDKLEYYTTSFAQWDEAYNFLKKTNQQFIDSNFAANTFTSSNDNFYIYFDTAGKLYYGKAYDLINSKFTTVPDELLSAVKPLTLNLKMTDKYTGIIKISSGYVAFSLFPVLTGTGKGPIGGSNLMGYYITDKNFEDISHSVEMKVEMIPFPIKNNSLSTIAYVQLLTGNADYIAPKSKDTMYGFSFIKDIYGNPIAMMKVEIPRTIYGEGLITIYHYLGIMMALGVIILATMWLLLKKLVLDRVLTISEQVITINSEGNFHKRISISGNDELKNMTSSINSMLELIQLTQEQLKYRISRRTKELEKISGLNRNLFGEINKKRSTELKLREDEKVLRQLAYYDALTGLPKGVFFDELLIKAISRATLNNAKLAVMFMDIDKFKKINDTYGHEFADKLLKQVARQLKSVIRETDVVARIGGDEFILFIDDISGKEMVDQIVANIFEALAKITTIDGIAIKPFFSMGISIFPDDGKTLEELANQSNLAMYYAKKREGNIYYYYGAIKNKQDSLSLY